jgi:hypothetical protein
MEIRDDAKDRRQNDRGRSKQGHDPGELRIADVERLSQRRQRRL